MKSIMQKKDNRCYLCMLLHGNDYIYPIIHKHHVYRGKNRRISEENGFTVYLCPNHHVYGPYAVHNNKELLRLLEKRCQEIYEESHDRKEFEKLLGKSFLEED